MGGYNGQNKQYLSSCEKYDLINDNWSYFASMNKEKCSFACIVIYILILKELK